MLTCANLNAIQKASKTAGGWRCQFKKEAYEQNDGEERNVYMCCGSVFSVSGQKCHQRADILGLTHLVWATSKNVKDRVKLSDREYKVDRFHICFYLNNFNLSQNSSLSALCSSRQIDIPNCVYIKSRIS